jgi:hypothetical protein
MKAMAMWAAGVAALAAGPVIGWSAAGGAAVTHAAVVQPMGGTVSGPAVRPSDFSHPRGNPYFPLRPGLVLLYRGTDGPAKFRERVAVTHKTKMIQGIKAAVVVDILRRADGSVAEATRDWYADDNAGNVWYLGEATATYDRHGDVQSREGSWQAGVKGAVAGMIMPAHPRPTDAYRQEYWRGHAEDQAWIVQVDDTVTVPAGSYHQVVRSYEWSRLEKGSVSVKFYARGLGIVSEHDVSGGTENFKLVRVTGR